MHCKTTQGPAANRPIAVDATQRPVQLEGAIGDGKTFSRQEMRQKIAASARPVASATSATRATVESAPEKVMAELAKRYDIPGLTYERYNQASNDPKTREGHCLSVENPKDQGRGGSGRTYYFYDPARHELLALKGSAWEVVKPHRDPALGQVVSEAVLAAEAGKGLAKITDSATLTDAVQAAASLLGTPHKDTSPAGHIAETATALRDTLHEVNDLTSRLEYPSAEERALLVAKEKLLAGMAKLLREGEGTQQYDTLLRKTGVDPKRFLEGYATLEKVRAAEASILGAGKDEHSNEAILFWRRHLVDDMLSNSFRDDPSSGRNASAVIRRIRNPAGFLTVGQRLGLDT